MFLFVEAAESPTAPTNAAVYISATKFSHLPPLSLSVSLLFAPSLPRRGQGGDGAWRDRARWLRPPFSTSSSPPSCHSVSAGPSPLAATDGAPRLRCGVGHGTRRCPSPSIAPRERASPVATGVPPTPCCLLAPVSVCFCAPRNPSPSLSPSLPLSIAPHPPASPPSARPPSHPLLLYLHTPLLSSLSNLDATALHHHGPQGGRLLRRTAGGGSGSCRSSWWRSGGWWWAATAGWG